MARIGLFQVDNTMSGDVRERQNVMLKMAESCLKDGADLVFFPECFQYAATELSPLTLSETYAAEWKKRCSALAKKYRAYVVPWDYCIGDGGKVYNSSYILNREGDFVGRYDKCNLTYSEIMKGIALGESIPVFDLDVGKVGIMICFDNYFPEVAATLGNKGAELVLYPLYGDTLKPQWELKMRTRAIDHGMHIASSQIDSKQKVSFTGMVDPEGNIITRLENDGSWCTVDVDLKKRTVTNTWTNKQAEYLRDYLHKCRNPRAFTDLADVGAPTKEWDEIFIK